MHIESPVPSISPDCKSPSVRISSSGDVEISSALHSDLLLAARSPSPLHEYHLDAAHYHNESAAYHDRVSEYFDSGAEYHDKAVEYHDSQARFHRVQFESPVASYFPVSSEILLEPLIPITMQKSMAGSLQGSSDLPEAEARLSSSSTLRPSSMMSATDPKHSSLPVARDFALPVAHGTNPTEAEPNGRPIKWILRAKTPSFSSDSEAETYNGPSVFMNGDKGWEPDVKKAKKKSKAGSSCQGSSSSNTSTVKHASSAAAGSGLQVPSFGTQGTHSRTSSGISGLSRITAASGVTEGSDQDELVTRMLEAEQQVRNAENHVKAMREALAKAFKEREDAEDRTAVAEAQLKSSLALWTNERSETGLMEKFRLTEEKLNVSQALLEKSRERNVEYEERYLKAEGLVQKMTDKVKIGVPAIVHSANADVAEIQVRLNEATQRAVKAEKQLKKAIAELEGDLAQSYRNAVERAEIAEKRAQTAEEHQEKDRLWAVNADERAINAESRVTELRAELVRSHNVIADHQILLMRATSRAEKAEQDLKDAEDELKAFENRTLEYERVAFEFKTKYSSLKRYTDKLQDHHNEREKEYMACNADWTTREADFAKTKEEMKKLEDVNQEMGHDKQLIITSFANAITQMKESRKMMSQEEIDRLVEWAAKSPESKKGKDASNQSIAVVREKARRNLEGLPFTPSLEVEQATFAGPAMEVPTVSPVSSPASPSDEEAVLRKQMAAVQTADGVLRLPPMSRGAWYQMNKTPK